MIGRHQISYDQMQRIYNQLEHHKSNLSTIFTINSSIILISRCGEWIMVTDTFLNDTEKPYGLLVMILMPFTGRQRLEFVKLHWQAPLVRLWYDFFQRARMSTHFARNIELCDGEEWFTISIHTNNTWNISGDCSWYFEQFGFVESQGMSLPSLSFYSTLKKNSISNACSNNGIEVGRTLI